MSSNRRLGSVKRIERDHQKLKRYFANHPDVLLDKFDKTSASQAHLNPCSVYAGWLRFLASCIDHIVENTSRIRTFPGGHVGTSLGQIRLVFVCLDIVVAGISLDCNVHRSQAYHQQTSPETHAATSCGAVCRVDAFGTYKSQS